jgi:hypothetical protein
VPELRKRGVLRAAELYAEACNRLSVFIEGAPRWQFRQVAGKLSLRVRQEADGDGRRTAIATDAGEETVRELVPEELATHGFTCLQFGLQNRKGHGHMRVTHEMAVDAGDRQLEDMEWGCSTCNGDGWILEEVGNAKR